MKYQREAVEPPYPTPPQSVTERRKYSPVCLPGALEHARQSTLAREAEELGSGDSVIGRLSEGFRKLTTEEQMQAILSAKMNQATSIVGEIAKVGKQEEKGVDARTTEQSAG